VALHELASCHEELAESDLIAEPRGVSLHERIGLISRSPAGVSHE
jgi:hypothetical protein